MIINLDRKKEAVKQFIETNCSSLHLSGDGLFALIKYLDSGNCEKKTSLNETYFILSGSIDLSEINNLDLCKMFIEAGIEIKFDGITISSALTGKF